MIKIFLLFSMILISFYSYAGLQKSTPHVVDASTSAVVLKFIDNAQELNPLGFVGVLIAKVAFEAAAQGYRDAGDQETCQSIATGARMGSWFGTGATLGSLAGGPYGLAAGGIVALVLSWDWSKQSAIDTCSQELMIDHDPFSFSGKSCFGWNDARPDFCNSFWSFSQ